MTNGKSYLYKASLCEKCVSQEVILLLSTMVFTKTRFSDNDKEKTDSIPEKPVANRRKRGPARPADEKSSDSEDEPLNNSRRSPRIREISETREKSTEKENLKNERRSRSRKSGLVSLFYHSTKKFFLLKRNCATHGRKPPNKGER